MSDLNGNRARTREVVAMFDRIAPLYDAMNTVMTAGADARWRRAAVSAAGLRSGDRVLDVACGSGALTRAAARAVGTHGRVVGVDLSAGMLRRARRGRTDAGAAEPEYLSGDALALPVDTASFDAALVAFGLRNLPDYSAALREMARAVRPGGRVVVVEIAVPRGGPAALVFRIWFQRAVPLLGVLVGERGAYRYLPASLGGYPAPERIAELMAASGLDPVAWRWLTSGMATLHVGRRRPDG